MTYSHDPVSGVWVRDGHRSFSYSDGDGNEEYLATVIAGSRDLSCYSPELLAAIKDWPSEYHLSPSRHNLLRPFAFRPTDRVLELGGGCGAITRFLAERCGTVVSVEGSQRRAAIAASRCRDLRNVSVYCDNLLDFRTEENFDYVLLIGVLEYATKYGHGEDRAADCLKHASSMLADHGQLVVAIENQLGLKYFAGCAEDHHTIPFFGVSDLYTKDQTTTYGRRALCDVLARAGLSWNNFYYPFPDYKLPTLMLTTQALETPQLNVADLLLTCPSRDYHDDRYRCFDEGLAWRPLHRNGLLPDFANSFLVLSGKGEPRPPESWLCKSYNRSVRHGHFAVETTFTATGSGILVGKERCLPESSQTGTFRNETVDSTYLEGSLLLNRIREAWDPLESTCRHASLSIL